MTYDIIGDIHGCYKEFTQLIKALDYSWVNGLPKHRDKRKLIFIGDITDRGPDSLKVIDIVTNLVEQNLALYIPGNHCNKLYRYLIGRPVQIKHGLETTVSELENIGNQQKLNLTARFKKLYEYSSLYLVLDQNKLVVAHAGIKAEFIGKTNDRVKTFVLYGDITGQTDEQGKPIRKDWANSYKGDALIIYGHTPVFKPRKINNTINIDTGCVFGGALTAYRYPELTTVSIQSSQPFIKEKFTQY